MTLNCQFFMEELKEEHFHFHQRVTLNVNGNYLNASMDVIQALDVTVGKDRDFDGLSSGLDVVPTGDARKWTFLK